MSEEEIIDILKNKLFFDEYEYGISIDDTFCEAGYDAQIKAEKAIQRFIRVIPKGKRKE